MITKREMKKLKKGDLVYLPSEVTLYKFDKGETFTSRSTTTSKPMTTALVNQVDNLCEVLYNGEVWSVETNNIFLGVHND